MDKAGRIIRFALLPVGICLGFKLRVQNFMMGRTMGRKNHIARDQKYPTIKNKITLPDI